MQVVIAYVWMVPIIVGYMVHLLAYAPGGCSRLFTLSCMCSWMHCLNCTLDIGCNIWFVFYREVFSLSRVFGPDKTLGEATFCDWEIIIQATSNRIRPVIQSQLWSGKSFRDIRKISSWSVLQHRIVAWAMQCLPWLRFCATQFIYFHSLLILAGNAQPWLYLWPLQILN